MNVGNDFNPRSRFIIVVSTLSFAFLALLVILSFKKPSDKVFGVDNFYSSVAGSDEDPKALYSRLYENILATGVECNTNIKQAQDPKIAGNCTWVVDGRDFEGLDKYKVDGSESIAPYIEGDMIVSPTTLVFENANNIMYEEGEIGISAYIGDKYLIRFDDVACWWCHVGKDNPDKHSLVVGSGGIYSKVTEGYIIGEAKGSTTVSLFEINDDGTRVQVSLSELFE